MDKIRAAVVGCGNISRSHFSAIEKNENIVLACVCDNQSDRADDAAKKYGCKAFYSFDEMLNWGEFDVIHICTPHYLHSEMAIKGLNAGKNVLSEKPMAMNLAEATAIYEAAKKSSGQYGVCFQNRYNPSSQKMKEVLDSGKLGKILGGKGIVCWDRDENYYLADEWRGKKKTEGGGVLINQSIHTLDLLLWMINSSVTDVKSSISTKRLADFIEVEDTADMLLSFSDGQRAVFYATICGVGNDPVCLDIICENGKMRLGEKLIITNPDDTQEIYDIDRISGTKSYWGTGHNALISDFYDCIKTDRHFEIDENEGIKTISVLDKIYNK